MAGPSPVIDCGFSEGGASTVDYDMVLVVDVSAISLTPDSTVCPGSACKTVEHQMGEVYGTVP